MKEAICFDCESTGIDVFEDRIVQFVISGVESDGSIAWTREWLIDPGIDIPEEASAVHGFTSAYIKEHGRNPDESLPEIRDTFLDNRDMPWIAYNLNYDLSILDAEFRRHQVTDTFGTWTVRNADLIDPLLYDRHFDKYRKGKRKLEFVAPHYGIDFDPEAAHKADYDVEITAKVAAKVLERYGRLSNAEQARSYREWAEHLEEYLRKTDPEATVDASWPLRLKED